MRRYKVRLPTAFIVTNQSEAKSSQIVFFQKTYCYDSIEL